MCRHVESVKAKLAKYALCDFRKLRSLKIILSLMSRLDTVPFSIRKQSTQMCLLMAALCI